MIKDRLWEAVFKAVDASVWAKNQFQMMFARDKAETYPMKQEFGGERGQTAVPKVNVASSRAGAKKAVAKATKKVAVTPRPALTLSGRPRQKPGPKPGSKRKPKLDAKAPVINTAIAPAADVTGASVKKVAKSPANAKKTPGVTVKAAAATRKKTQTSL